MFAHYVNFNNDFFLFATAATSLRDSIDGAVHYFAVIIHQTCEVFKGWSCFEVHSSSFPRRLVPQSCQDGRITALSSLTIAANEHRLVSFPCVS